MRKVLIGLVALSLVVATAPANAKKKTKLVPADVTYYNVGSGDACGSLTLTQSEGDGGCGNPFYGILEPADPGGGVPMQHLAVDGLPLTLDTSKPITGSVTVQSYLLAGAPMDVDVVGVGQAVLTVVLTGTTGGEEVTIGEFESAPYLVTPAEIEYVVEVEIAPDEALNGKVFDSLTMSLKNIGNSLFHGVYPADGTTQLTFGALVKK
ncbi:MAG TPA: hypothetical protein VHJ82_03935 [Actinomycetota bacterium]|nr:hypothetical protein [Actinomycetota bacterium]